nr:unnamed protein product [Callosobruchus analis]
MPFRFCVPGCNGNYSAAEVVHIFSFPSEEVLRKRWASAIHRDNFIATKNSRICERHFAQESILWISSYYDKSTGKTVTISLLRPRLKADAVPTLLPNCPQYLSKNVTYRKSRDKKLLDIEKNNILKSLAESIDDFAVQKEKTMFESYTQFLIMLKSWQCPDGWVMTCRDKVVIFKINCTDSPIITDSVKIDRDLKAETYLYTNRLSLNTKHNLKTPCSLNNITDLDEIIAYLDGYTNGYQVDKTSLPSLINYVCDLLNNIPQNEESKLQETIPFICEQLKLCIMPKERYRYSNQTLVLCSIIFTVSPHAYNYLRNHGQTILPHQTTLKSICNKYLTDSTSDERNSFLAYAKNVIHYSEPDQKHVVLLMDEIHIQPCLGYEG